MGISKDYDGDDVAAPDEKARIYFWELDTKQAEVGKGPWQGSAVYRLVHKQPCHGKIASVVDPPEAPSTSC